MPVKAVTRTSINGHRRIQEFDPGFIKARNERNTQYKIAKRYGMVEGVNKAIEMCFERLLKA